MLTNPPIPYLLWVNTRLAQCLNSVSNVGTFNKEKALVGASSVIVKTDGSFAALITTLQHGAETEQRQGQGGQEGQHEHSR